MEASFVTTLSRLRAGEFLRIEDGAGRSVSVFDGLVWVTQVGDPLDAFVSKGETFTLDRAGLTVIEALTDTRLTVLETEPAYGDADDRAFA